MYDYPQQVLPGSPTHALQHQHAHPALLLRALQARLGPACLEWDPEVVWHETIRHFGSKPSRLAQAKIQAVRTILSTYRVWEDWPTFAFVGASLYRVADAAYLPKLAPYQCVGTVRLMQALSSYAPGHSPLLSPDVLKYIAACLHDAGVVYAPPPLMSCNRFLNNLTDSTLHAQCREHVYSDAPVEADGPLAEALATTRALEEYGDWYMGLADKQAASAGLLKG